MVRIINLLLILFISWQAEGVNLTGKVSDESGQPIPFVVVYVDGTTHGTTSNIDGEYSLELKPGKYLIDYNLIGYVLHTETIEVASENIIRNVQLKTEGVHINEVTIKASSEDPAYRIIREAIKKRKYYLEQVNSYSCDVYIKGVQRVVKHPQKLFGQTLNLGELDSSGIVYLSESVSKFYFKQPDNIKEEMVSSKVSGNNNAFSYNQASDMLINLYKNNIQVPDLSERGFISPIAGNALFFYKYHLAGTLEKDGHIIDKIEVIPKRRYDPVFRGYIYIMEDAWRVYSANLYLTKDAQIEFVDTLYVDQSFLPVDSATWMPFSNQYRFNFNILGIKGDGMFIGINKNYVLNPDPPKNFFHGEVMKVDDDANKKDSAYWKDTRPVPLTKQETHDYQRRDSLEKKYESKPYLDSLDRKRNKFKLTNLLFGYNYYQRYKKQTWNLMPIIQTIDYNTVQGLNIGIKLSYTKEYENNKRLYVLTSGGYGFSDKTWFGDAVLGYVYKPEKRAYFNVGLRVKPVQFNGYEPISPFINTLYTLLQDQNYMKLYHSNSAYFSQGEELVNGLSVSEGAQYAERTPLMNTTNYKLVQIGSRQYTSNDPVNPRNDSVPSFQQTNLFDVWLRLRIHLKQEYISRPHEKIIEDSRVPVFDIVYMKALNGFAGLNESYDFVKATVTGSLGLKLFGESNYSISAGKFLSQNNLQFMDYHHFEGNQTIFSDFNLNSFHLLNYYQYSTSGRFLEAHFEHNFHGFIFNKIPLLRKLKLDEMVGVNYLTTSTLPQYVEIFAGISKLQSLRIDFATSIMKNGRVSEGFVIGIGF